MLGKPQAPKRLKPPPGRVKGVMPTASKGFSLPEPGNKVRPKAVVNHPSHAVAWPSLVVHPHAGASVPPEGKVTV